MAWRSTSGWVASRSAVDGVHLTLTDGERPGVAGETACREASLATGPRRSGKMLARGKSLSLAISGAAAEDPRGELAVLDRCGARIGVCAGLDVAILVVPPNELSRLRIAGEIIE